MNVQPNANIVSLAGIARAQARSGDTDTAKNLQAALNQQQSPGKTEGVDALTLEASEKSGDRDGDGRMIYDSQDDQKNEKEQDQQHQASPPISTDGCGEQLDLEM